MENKPDYIDIIEENLAESVVAIIFMLAFLGTGLITAYFIEDVWIKDGVIASSIIFGFSALLIKLKQVGTGE